jgi:hypothetical protein
MATLPGVLEEEGEVGGGSSEAALLALLLLATPIASDSRSLES